MQPWKPDSMPTFFLSCHMVDCHVGECHVGECHVSECPVGECHVVKCHVVESDKRLILWIVFFFIFHNLNKVVYLSIRCQC